ncbi:hypothetical protein K437DRAFT_245502 [Tilletiaria anomala UBC 951]|uniref:Cysteine protease n=1 Tax=Tilletiaria anomala (strain ATCC 24038 / CBS 436.72 / UBC 951) TaxID=1037660 RepID=A0A066W3H3_TILAU|nr:uncharacterized protein K437DRAFT_245502 [Tilletiaria anomala UBC 951]KDN48512.1 hypothetical protein K437DRAFT_245502 [Tilletiaria anomala UBC 951]
MESTSDLLGRADNTGGCWLLGVWHGKGSSLEVEDDSAEQDATTPSITLSSATPKGNKTSRLHRGTRNDRTPSPDLTGPTRDGFDSPSLPKSPPLVSVSALSARNSDSLWQQDFQSDFQSRIWCTYRSHFRMGIPGLWHRATAVAQAAGLAGRSGLTTDAGWGCMLRTGQSLLANALVHVTFGRNWRRPQSAADLDEDAERRREYARYIRILTWFMDDPSPACPFSVHRMAREGKSLGKEVGEWFGPSTAAGAIKRLVDECAEAKLGVVVATDGEIYLSHIKAASRIRGKKNTWERPVLILIGVRLGLSGVNPTYYESIKTTFAFPHTAGIAGGRPSSSYYFVGVQDSSLLYLDPHHVRPSVPFRFPPPSLSGAELDKWLCRAYSEAQIGTFHCDRVRRMPLRSLDPSMLLGFICTDEQSLEDFCSRVKALPKTLFSIAENPPKWAQQVDDLELAMESFSDDSFDADVEEEHGQDSLLLEKDDQNQEARVVIGQNGKGEEQKERAGTAAHERISSWTHEAATRQPFPQALKKDISSEGNSNSDSSLGLGVRFPTMSERERGSDEDRGEELDGVESRSTRLRPTTDRITSSASGTSDLTERERSDSAAQRIPLKYLVHAQSHSPSFRRSRVQSRPSAFTSTSVSVSVPAAEAGAEGAAKVDESGIDESFSTLDFSDADDSSGSTTGVDRWEQIPRTSHRRAPEPRPDDCQTESEVLGRTPSLYSHTLYPQQQRQQQRDAAPLPPSTPEGNDEEHHEVEKNDTQFVHRTAHAL